MFRRFIPRSGKARRLTLLAGALLTGLAAVPMSGAALAQSPPPDDDLKLVNRDRQMVERKKEGEFVARPIFSRKTEVLYYSIRHPDTGAWITNTYRVQGGEQQLSEGWEYTFEYPALSEQPELHPEQGYLLVLAVPRTGGGDHHVFHALIPVHQPKGLVGQGAGRARTGPLGPGRRPVGDPGNPRDSLRRGAEDRGNGRCRVPGGVAVWATSSPEPLPN